jgi:hypothetical protein
VLPFIETEDTWETNQGDVIPVVHMSDQHLKNTIKMLLRKRSPLLRFPVLKTMLNELLRRQLQL